MLIKTITDSCGTHLRFRTNFGLRGNTCRSQQRRSGTSQVIDQTKLKTRFSYYQNLKPEINLKLPLIPNRKTGLRAKTEKLIFLNTENKKLNAEKDID